MKSLNDLKIGDSVNIHCTITGKNSSRTITRTTKTQIITEYETSTGIHEDKYNKNTSYHVGYDNGTLMFSTTEEEKPENLVIEITINSFESHYNIFVNNQSHFIKGCPMGRGSTEQEAIKDLIYRIKIESNIDVTIKPAPAPATLKNVHIYSSLQIDLLDIDYLLQNCEKYLITNDELSLYFDPITEDKDIIDLLEVCLNIDQSLLKPAIKNFCNDSGFTINLDLVVLNKEINSTIEQVEKWIDHLQLDCINLDCIIRKYDNFDLKIELIEFKLISPMSVQLIIGDVG